ncbi:MAG: hypothetical protein E6Q66_08250 [Pedobacter sp.]|nr:MAG: hypothetical protein E6Q66_08250 [Pedobacter sp.]
MGKEFAKTIEGVNTWLISVCKRLVRRNTAFSKRS